MSEDSEHTGGCLCGAIRYRVSGPPNWSGLCHCESCRRATGGAAVAYAGFPTEKFRFESGEPAAYGSSDGVVRSFCPKCGTSLTYVSTRWPAEIHILVGTADNPGNLAPQGHFYCKYKLPWLQFDDGLPAFPTVPSEYEPK